MSEQLIATPGVFGENGNFLLERELGSGGMGGVYMGRDKMLDRPVAVKVMLKEYGSDPEFVEKFKKEAQAAAKLIHPNIAQIYSYGISDGMPYIAMELVAGGSLWGLMKNNMGKTDVPRVLKICQQVAQALQCSSDQGYVHGDIKPENVLLDANGNAKIVDFGLAGMQKDTDEIWGTPYYIAPEKVKQEVVDYRADMYNLGGTLYHALTGVPPFDGEDVNAVVKARFMGPPKKPSEIRPDLTPQIDALVLKMLAFDKAERFPSFEALIEEFKKVLTTGLETSKIPRPSLDGGGAKQSGGRRVVMRGGRRVTTMRKIRTAEGSEESSGAEEAEASKAQDEDEDEKGGHLGLKVLGVVLGAILLVGGVVGGLIWYKVSDRRAREEAHQAQISKNIGLARAAIDETGRAALKFADDVDELAKKALDGCRATAAELQQHMPDFAEQLNPGPTKELLDAIASTNETAVAAAPAAPAAPAAEAAATNAAPAEASTTATNAAPAAAAAPAETNAAAAENQAQEKPKDVPQAVNDMAALWERAYSCQAGAVKVRHAMRGVAAACAKASAITGDDEASMEALSKLSLDVKEMHDQVVASKDVENVRKGAGYVRDRGKKILEQALKRLRIEKLESDRAKAKAAAEEAEKKRLEAQAEAKAKLVEEETEAAKEKFGAIASQGSFRQLDWKGALRQLEAMKAEFKSPEGSLAADVEIRKVNAMKAVHDAFRKNLQGYAFKRGKLKGCVVKSADEGGIKMVRPDGKTPVNITFAKFYQTAHGNLNELIIYFIENGRENCRPKMNLREWAEAMCGAALTMRVICPEVNGAAERVKGITKKVVDAFPDYARNVKEMFPDLELGGAAEDE